MCGLNVIGMRRAGMAADQRHELKQLYRLLFHNQKHLSHAMAEAEARSWSEQARHMIESIKVSKRGVCRPARFTEPDEE